MKKFIALILIIILSLVIVGCSGIKNTNYQENNKKEKEEKLLQETLGKLAENNVSITVENKRLFKSSDNNEYVVFDITILNYLPKNIKAFKGYFIFKDLSGNNILKINYMNDEELKATEATGAKKHSITVKVNELINEHKFLRDTKLSDMKCEWYTTAIVFTDGTSIGDIKQ